MWALVNRTAYAADRGWIRDRTGAESWVVAVKATYDILADGALCLAADQVPVFAGPVNDETSGELLYDSDLGPAKSGSDVVLMGSAQSPTGSPVAELEIGFSVGALSRRAMVYGDRIWRKGYLRHSPGRPEPFVRMPLSYSRAFGGDDPAGLDSTGNPRGCGIVCPRDGPYLMPNFEDFAQRLSTPTDRPSVAAFGAVPEHWPWRLRHAGTFNDHWLEHRRPLLPEDVDERSWRVAPPAQQMSAHLRGGEPVGLVNLTRPGFCAASRLNFELPRVSLGFETRFYDGSIEHGRSTIHTVILESEGPRVIVLHHMSLRCHPKVNLLDRTIILEKRRPLDPTPDATNQELSL